MIGVWIAVALALGSSSAVQAPKQPKAPAKSPKKKPAAKKASTWTGCVAQQGEYFFLTDDRELKPTARLEGDDPERASYAKYMGQKVEVTGTEASKTEDGLPSIKVQQIKKLADSCTPEDR